MGPAHHRHPGTPTTRHARAARVSVLLVLLLLHLSLGSAASRGKMSRCCGSAPRAGGARAEADRRVGAEPLLLQRAAAGMSRLPPVMQVLTLRGGSSDLEVQPHVKQAGSQQMQQGHAVAVEGVDPTSSSAREGEGGVAGWSTGEEEDKALVEGGGGDGVAAEQMLQKRPRELEDHVVSGEAGRAKLPLREWVDDVPEMEGYREEEDSDWSPSDQDLDPSDDSDAASRSTRNSLSSHSLSEAHEVRDTATDRALIDLLGGGSNDDDAQGATLMGEKDLPSRTEGQTRAACSEQGQREVSGGVGASFVASAFYDGKREGHVFREGLFGLGYYRDWAWRGQREVPREQQEEQGGHDEGQGGGDEDSDAVSEGDGGGVEWEETKYNVTERGTKVVVAQEVMSDEVDADSNFVEEVDQGGNEEVEEQYGYQEFDEDGYRVNASAWQKMICDAAGIKCHGPGGEDGSGAVEAEERHGKGGGDDGGGWEDGPQENPFIDAFVRAAREEEQQWGWGPRQEGYVKVTPPGPGEAYQYVDGDEGWEELEGSDTSGESGVEWMTPEEIAEAHPGQPPPVWFEGGGMPATPQVLNASEIVAQTKRYSCGCASMMLPCLTCQGIPRCMAAPVVHPIRELSRKEWARAVPEDAGRTEWPAEEGEETENLVYYKDYPPHKEHHDAGLSFS